LGGCADFCTLFMYELNPIEVFAATYLPHYLKCRVPLFHRDIYAHLWDVSYSRLVVEAPRDFAKSTVLSIIYPLYLICEGNVEELMSFSRSGRLARKWVRRIVGEIENNELLRSDYGLAHGSVWTKDHIIVKRGDGFQVELVASGKGSSARGSRGYVFIDDPQDKGDVTSDAILEADRDWFFEDVINILEPGQRLIFIGSRLSPVSLLSEVSVIKGWTHLSYQAFGPDGHSIWPEKWPDEALEQRRAEIGNDRFMSEFMNQPRVSDNPVFTENWVKNYLVDSAEFEALLRKGMFTVTAVDPAISQRENADFTAIVTVSATFEDIPRIYVRDARRDHWSMKDSVEQLFQIYDKYKQNKTVVETVAYQQAMMEEIRERQRIYNINVNPYEVKPDKDKARRAYNIQSLFQEGRVYMDLTDRGQRTLLQEMIMFSGKSNSWHDDLVDAMVYALTEVKKWRHKPRRAQSYEGVTVYGQTV